MKNKEIAKAWLNGETVEWKEEGKDEWVTLFEPEVVADCPSFADRHEYRIKPKTKFVYSYISCLATFEEGVDCFFEYQEDNLKIMGEHMMFEVNEDGRILNCWFSNSNALNKEFVDYYRSLN
jgi:hypothetical protein